MKMPKGVLIAIIVIAVCIAAAAVGIIIYTTSSGSTDSGTSGGSVPSSGLNIGFEDDQKNIVRSSDPVVCIPGYDKVYIDADKKEVYIDLDNPAENEGLFYLTYELRLADTGEVLYTSKLIKPGDSVKIITLSRALPAGTYKAVLHVQPYTADANMKPTYNTDLYFDLIAD